MVSDSRNVPKISLRHVICKCGQRFELVQNTDLEGCEDLICVHTGLQSSSFSLLSLFYLLFFVVLLIVLFFKLLLDKKKLRDEDERGERACIKVKEPQDLRVAT